MTLYLPGTRRRRWFTQGSGLVDCINADWNINILKTTHMQITYLHLKTLNLMKKLSLKNAVLLHLN
jgi:hypothetical protein